MKDINAGIKGEAALKVSENEFAVNVGSGSLEVFATPVMVMLMEKAACCCVASYMENDETTVGTEMNVKHLSASPAGSDIRAEAELTEVNGRELVFSVKAYDNCELIGEGKHKRFLVFGERFTEKAKAKLQ